MTEDTDAASFQREGDAAFSSEGTEEENSAAPQAGNDTTGDTHAPGGDNNQDDDKTPFHEHPRWKQREEEWNSRFNDQERRHQEDLKSIREEFGAQRRDNAQPSKPPAWFGGTQEQWDAYRSDRDAELKAAEDRAIARLTKDRETATQQEQEAVAAATTYMRSEMAAIENDKELNPTGIKFDQKTAEKLLQTVLDENLVDTQGRWNYRAGFKLMQSGKPATPAPKPDTKEKKEVAAATSGGSRGEAPKQAVATSKDFEKDRPW